MSPHTFGGQHATDVCSCPPHTSPIVQTRNRRNVLTTLDYFTVGHIEFNNFLDVFSLYGTRESFSRIHNTFRLLTGYHTRVFSCTRGPTTLYSVEFGLNRSAPIMLPKVWTLAFGTGCIYHRTQSSNREWQWNRSCSTHRLLIQPSGSISVS